MEKEDDNMIYFTSDLHLGHRGIIEMQNRPFENIQEMNQVLIRNYNAVVHKNELFVTNPDTNFWLIMIIVKVTNGGIYHECRKRTFAIR